MFLYITCTFERVFCKLLGVKPRVNGRNIVGQQLPTLLDVTCCVRLQTLLHVVGCCCAKFETGQTFQPTTPNISFVPWSPKRIATMLEPFAQLFQHCWGHVRSLCMVYKDLWGVSFPWCTAGPNIVSATILGVVASVCTQPYVYKKSITSTISTSRRGVVVSPLSLVSLLVPLPR